MTAIPTVTGTADSAELGRVLVHEHVFVLSEKIRQNYADWDEDDIDPILVRNPRRYFEK
ncbi:hypothetical protein ACIBG0_14975 [Nocardia sp. NPDC050630]|uniref:hypothetical protein n=1 Tax=Nocardia sp. NPDC050630 TaxID=3364321 RepID=UPI0037A5EE2E